MMRFADAVSQRGDLPYEELDFFPTGLDALPDLFFAGNYFDLSFPLVRKSALGRLAAIADELEVLEVPTAETGDVDIMIVDPFDRPLGRGH